MTVKFMYDIGDIHICKIAEMQSNSSDEDIKQMYYHVMYMEFKDVFSSYEIVKEGD